MKRFMLLVVSVATILLAGCSFLAPTEVPTSTATTAFFIRVPSPTGGSPESPTATRAPISIVETTSEMTPTATVTATPTPIPITVSVLPDPSGYSWQEVITGLDNPVGLVNAGDGSKRMFILEQTGLIRVFKDGALLPAPFLDLRQKVSCCGERGLLGLAFHPHYRENGYFYVDYTEKEGNQLNTVIARFSVSTSDPDQAMADSETRLLLIQQPYQNHNGGQILFGPDGYMYIGMGDGGSAGDPEGNGQSLQTRLGKILRIDVDHAQPYAIPTDNPLTNIEGDAWEIWAYGLRNPWRFCFDPVTGDLYIGDVGQDAWEEIDYLPAGSTGGANFGWNFYEGSHPYRGSPPAADTFVMPVAEYSHEFGQSVTGGYVYRGKNLLDWSGVYIYGDYVSGRVWGLLHLLDGSWQNAQVFDTGRNISSFGVDEDGEIYLVDYGGAILILQ